MKSNIEQNTAVMARVIQTKEAFSIEGKIRIIMEGIQNEISISELCNQEGIDASLYHQWCKDFLQMDNGSFVVDIEREELSGNVYHIENENILLKNVVKDLRIKNSVLKRKLAVAR